MPVIGAMALVGFVRQPASFSTQIVGSVSVFQFNISLDKFASHM
jgi:hypothetical protein